MRPAFVVQLFFFFLLLSGISSAQESLRTVTNRAFRPGEKLSFRLHYGFVDAGKATLEVDPDIKKIGSRECYHVIGTGRSIGAFDWFFKVRDRFESFVDCNAMVPWLFIRNVEEGSYRKKQRAIFHHYKDSVSSEKKTIFLPKHTQDLISAFYYARTIDFAAAKPGDVFPINGYLDDEIISLNIKLVGREKLTTDLGVFQCIILRPMLKEGRVFKEEEDMTIWVSDDLNRIPVRVQSNIMVGSIKMDLTGYENLLNRPALVGK